MQLPSSLLREFARVTDDRPTPKKETTLYGTFIEDNGNYFVRLDGSNILTPVAMAMDARNGDRVVVMIKNHEAVITGNISNPASAYTASTYIKTIDETLLLVGGDNVGIRSESQVGNDIYRAEVIVDSRDADDPVVQLQVYKKDTLGSAKTIRISYDGGVTINGSKALTANEYYKYGSATIKGTITAGNGKTFFADLAAVPAGYKRIGIFSPQIEFPITPQANISISSFSLVSENRVRLRLNNYELSSVKFKITLTWLALRTDQTAQPSEIIDLDA